MNTKKLLPVRRVTITHRATKVPPAPPPLRLRHYKHVYWTTGDGPMVTAYRAVVVHDGCEG